MRATGSLVGWAALGGCLCRVRAKGCPMFACTRISNRGASHFYVKKLLSSALPFLSQLFHLSEAVIRYSYVCAFRGGGSANHPQRPFPSFPSSLKGNPSASANHPLPTPCAGAQRYACPPACLPACPLILAAIKSVGLRAGKRICLHHRPCRIRALGPSYANL